LEKVTVPLTIFMICTGPISRGETMDKTFGTLLDQVRTCKPLVHHITNYVTVNDCANITLAIGARPVMADSAVEVSEFSSFSDALVLNIGTLNERTVSSMISAGKVANEKGTPVILDPVGVGASTFRNDTASHLMSEIRLSVLRGNISEIRSIAGLSSDTRGVDASERDILSAYSSGEIARTLAKKLHCVVVISGAVDTISDGAKTAYVENGHPMLGSVTGTGCMCSSLIGSFCGVLGTNPFYAAASAMLCMGIAGELSYEKAGFVGSGSFRVALHDFISRMDAKTLERLGNYHEA